jgi:hypothetical protein
MQTTICVGENHDPRSSRKRAPRATRNGSQLTLIRRDACG